MIAELFIAFVSIPLIAIIKSPGYIILYNGLLVLTVLTTGPSIVVSMTIQNLPGGAVTCRDIELVSLPLVI